MFFGCLRLGWGNGICECALAVSDWDGGMGYANEDV